jgi:WAS family protein 3
MPFNKRTVEPILLSHVLVPKDIPNELECVSNHTLANVIRQLSSLSAHAQDLFEELINDAGHIFQRTEALHGRIERLKLKVTQLDSNVEEGQFDIIFLN